MKKFKGFIFAFTGLFIFITLLSLLMPSKVMTVRSVTIHADSAAVFAEIADLKNWKHWHPVFIHDSNSITISNPSVAVNASAGWDQDGKSNRLQFKEVLPGRITADLMRSGEKNTTNILSVMPLKDGNHVQAEWRVVTKLKWYPWEKFSGIFVDQMTGPGYETALNNLKNYLENKH